MKIELRARLRVAVLLALALASPMTARADVKPPPGMSPTAGNATSGSAAQIAANGGQFYSPITYGAKCDSNGTTGTDDSVAINAMFTAIRAADRPFTVTGPEARTCYIASTINMTGLNTTGHHTVPGSKINLRLDCATNGTPCVDALSSRWVDFEYLYINGESSNAASYGIQIGRISSASSDNLTFNVPVIQGYFTKVAFYNFAAETVEIRAPTFWNKYNSGGAPASYGMVQDGYNHFNITSAFVTQTLAVDTAQSFNQNTIIAGKIVTDGGNSVPLWLGATRGHTFAGTYVNSAMANCVHLYQESTVQNQNLIMDIHCEDNVALSVTDTILVTGTTAAQTLNGITYRDHGAHGSNSLIKTDTGVTSVSASDFTVDVNGFSSGASVKLFDNSSLWTVAGTVQLPAISNWTPPAAGAGKLCVLTTCYPYVPTTPLNRNPDFVLDQPNEGLALLSNVGGQAIVDGWHNSAVGGANVLSSFTWQRTTNSPPAGQTYSLIATTTNAKTPAATERYQIRTMIDSSDMTQLRWGTASAKPVTFDACLNANHTGEYDFSITSGAGDQAYIIPLNVTATGVWQCFSTYVTGPTAGTWAITPNTVGMFISFNGGSGSNFQNTGSAWQSGNYFATSGAYNLLGTAGATIKIGSVRLYPSPIDPPYLPRPYDQELRLAQRFYQKSFKIGTRPGQNLTQIGAMTSRAPYAQATFATVTLGKIPFGQPMYNNNGATAFPTMTAYSPAAVSANCYNITQARDSGAATFVNIDDQSVGVDCTLAVGDVLGDQISLHWTADTGF